MILRCVTTFRSYIDHYYLAAHEMGEINLLSSDSLYLKFMDRMHTIYDSAIRINMSRVKLRIFLVKYQ